jgi:hypothetical protein
VVRGYGGQVQLIPYVPGHSTTDLIETILRADRWNAGDMPGCNA